MHRLHSDPPSAASAQNAPAPILNVRLGRTLDCPYQCDTSTSEGCWSTGSDGHHVFLELRLLVAIPSGRYLPHDYDVHIQHAHILDNYLLHAAYSQHTHFTTAD